MADFATARRNMVDSQIRTNDVTDRRLIAALSSVRRELFVPPDKRPIAYMEEPLEVIAGRHLLGPRTFAKLVQALDVRETDVVLDVGCATGYSTAVLARLGSTVVAVEEDTDLVKEASDTLSELGVDTAATVQGKLSAGCAAQGPYDVILVNGGVEGGLEKLIDQLREGGRLGVVVMEGALGRAFLIRKAGSSISQRPLFDAVAPILPGFTKKPAFTF
ncbi:MAG TPA: protein-L-isoaspartate O-methyltransferase [Micropepsaceae bacterium]|nr:protein-L-isoaspartate O-methyltransferase [Micropepsaceae bacterium]